MDWLNYHHLHYFWRTAREGTVTAAAKQLRLAPSTLSAQIRTLEDQLGTSLFLREGRRLTLTSQGELALSFADEIFGTGQAMLDALRHGTDQRAPTRLRVGVSDILHKWLVHRALAPALTAQDPPVHLITRSDHADRLLADLALHELDLVLTDSPVGLAHDVPLRSTPLCSSPVLLAGTPALCEEWGADLPNSLDGAPLLLPGPGTSLRAAMEAWFEQRGLHPRVVAEFGDSALMKAFGRDGAGLLPVPAALADEVGDIYGVHPLFQLDGVREHLVAVSRPHAHPAVSFLTAAACEALT